MQHAVCIESICTIQTLSAHTVHSWVGLCIPHLQLWGAFCFLGPPGHRTPGGSPPGRRRRPGSWLQSASTRPLCEYGSCQCTRLTDVSSEAGLCLITAVLDNWRKRRGTQRRSHAGEADFLKRS